MSQTDFLRALKRRDPSALAELNRLKRTTCDPSVREDVEILFHGRN